MDTNVIKLLSYPYVKFEIKHIRRLFHVNQLRIKELGFLNWVITINNIAISLGL